MAVDDTFPRSNLPDLAVEWGRTVQDEIRSTQKTVNTLSQFTAGQNRTFASSLEQIARQLADIRQTQADIVSTQAEIQATQSFLVNQTVYAQVVGGGGGGTRSATAGAIVMEAYDPAEDVSITLTTSSTGNLSVTVSCFLVSGTISAGCGLEVVGVSTPDLFTSVSVTDAQVSGSRQFTMQLSGGSQYTFRTRRWYRGTTGGAVAYSNSGLSITKIGQ